ncbi:uncharacterized protein LOC120294923 isoform X3 [Eucalyptus grandis]|uniref:uncharacterized protein LOC120294923 isoform X3 n=1 Tax=Eucalyptus grandis TaxID=71139 RepID=UPI00192EDFDB|nr:uncharacterized protein LOC120294923 isoform X3 [Eucalyptus grandis]
MDGLLTKEHSCNYIACQTTLTSGVAPINFITNRLIGFNFLSLSIEMHKWKWMVPDHGDVHFALIGENICGKLVTQIIISDAKPHRRLERHQPNSSQSGPQQDCLHSLPLVTPTPLCFLT